ncbi:MAG: VWA domain-containing protein, partial [Chitinophagaceae bacterium]
MRPKIQIVFALDATGSMSGLIGAAREKIWSIAGSLAQADPSPVIEMGLLFYRDRGDQFVTRRVALSTELDDVYEKLMQIAADGGGDEPESVNQALHEAITTFSWDSAAGTYRTVFLVGDCPPHMDYRDDVKYPVSCALAKQNDIVLNTILMGNDGTARRIWSEIAVCNQGSFTNVNMDANDISVNTPYDNEIAILSDQLDNTRIYYGDAREKMIYEEKLKKGKSISGGSKDNVKAQRAEYNASKTGKETYYGKKELLEQYRNKSVDLETIKTEELPASMKTMSAAERKQFLDDNLSKRDSILQKINALSVKRQQYIEKDLSQRDSSKVENSFSNQMRLYTFT